LRKEFGMGQLLLYQFSSIPLFLEKFAEINRVKIINRAV
jgi:hypothetical protein